MVPGDCVTGRQSGGIIECILKLKLKRKLKLKKHIADILFTFFIPQQTSLDSLYFVSLVFSFAAFMKF